MTLPPTSSLPSPPRAPHGFTRSEVIKLTELSNIQLRSLDKAGAISPAVIESRGKYSTWIYSAHQLFCLLAAAPLERFSERLEVLQALDREPPQGLAAQVEECNMFVSEHDRDASFYCIGGHVFVFGVPHRRSPKLQELLNALTEASSQEPKRICIDLGQLSDIQDTGQARAIEHRIISYEDRVRDTLLSCSAN